MLDKYTFAGFPVVLSSQSCSKVIGYITRADLQTAIELAFEQQMNPFTAVVLSESDQPENLPESFIEIASYVDKFPMIISPETPLDILLDIFKGLGLRCSMVVKDERVVGIIKKKDIAEYISSTVIPLDILHLELLPVNATTRRESNAALLVGDGDASFVGNEEPLLNQEAKTALV